jgi:hypothetical protein
MAARPAQAPASRLHCAVEMEQAAQVVEVQAVQVAWQLAEGEPVDDARVLVAPGVTAGRAAVARQDVPVVGVAEMPGAAADKVVVNVQQVDWMPGVSCRVHSVRRTLLDLN